MLTYEQIKELIRLVTDNRLQELEIEKSGFRLRITGVGGSPSTAAASAVHTIPVAASGTAAASHRVATELEVSGSTRTAEATPAPIQPAAASPAPASTETLHVVTSPIVGTYYSAPSPEASSFVHVGDRVRKGQILCIIEAMKLMNEIESDVDGVVVEIHPRNAQPVEFGEPLFGVRPD